MTIGIDIDDTITNTRDVINKYGKIYALDNGISLDDMLSNKEYISKFLHKYWDKVKYEVTIKEGVKDTIDYLQEKGFKIVIITARSRIYEKDLMAGINYCLNQADIKIDDIFVEGKLKSDIVKKQGVDLLIDDNIDVYNEFVKEHLDILLFDDDNRYPYISNRVTSWKEVKKVLDMRYIDKNK